MALCLTIRFSIYLICHCIAVNLVRAFNYNIFRRHLKFGCLTPATKCITLHFRLFSQSYRTAVLIGFVLSILSSIDLICYCVAVNTEVSFNYYILSRHSELCILIPVAERITFFYRFRFQLN